MMRQKWLRIPYSRFCFFLWSGKATRAEIYSLAIMSFFQIIHVGYIFAPTRVPSIIESEKSDQNPVFKNRMRKSRTSTTLTKTYCGGHEKKKTKK